MCVCMYYYLLLELEYLIHSLIDSLISANFPIIEKVLCIRCFWWRIIILLKLIHVISTTPSSFLLIIILLTSTVSFSLSLCDLIIDMLNELPYFYQVVTSKFFHIIVSRSINIVGWVFIFYLPCTVAQHDKMALFRLSSHG